MVGTKVIGEQFALSHLSLSMLFPFKPIFSLAVTLLPYLQANIKATLVLVNVSTQRYNPYLNFYS